MAILDLASVTRSLKKLLETNINENWTDSETAVTATPLAPDKVGAETNHLSVFLYHVSEDPHYKNIEGPGIGGRNIARTPMALSLYYILTPIHEAESEEAPFILQTLMGWALKTLHDYPIITKDTVIAEEAILTGDMAENNNSMQIILRPVTPEEALAFWGSEDQQTARLAAYYEVRVIMLEPDEPQTVAAPVLSLGTYLYQLGTPHLETTHSELPFVLPTSAGATTQLVQVSPARASGDTGENPPHNRIVLTGQNLVSGKSRQLWLRSAAFTEAVDGPLPVDLSLTNNSSNGWALSVSDSRLVLDVDETLHYLDEAGDEQTIPLLPGIYTAFLRVRVSERIVGNALIPITNDSNEVPFVIIPRIASDTPDGVTNKIDVEIVPTFDLTLSSLELRLYVDGQAYTKQVGTTAAGRYEIINSTTLRFHALFDVDTDGEHPIRLVINGAESAPYWIETSAP